VTYDEMARAIRRRIPMITSMDPADILGALNEAQEQVASWAANRLGENAGPSVEYDEPARAPFTLDFDTLTSGDESNLPKCLHSPMSILAAAIIAESHPDVPVKMKIPERLRQEYAMALKEAVLSLKAEQDALLPSRIVDGYDPKRHVREEI
jgi:hypothetical protein